MDAQSISDLAQAIFSIMDTSFYLGLIAGTLCSFFGCYFGFMRLAGVSR